MVKNILIIRHCEAEMDSSSRRDFDRLLSKKGEAQAKRLGEHVEGLSLELDALYVSPAKRTMQTASLLMQALTASPRLMDAEELYEATENVLKAVVNRFDQEFNAVALIGHNPSVSGLFNYLSTDFCSFTPGTCAWMSFEVDDWQEISSNSGKVHGIFEP